VRGLNLALKFILELVASFSLALWGWYVGSPVHLLAAVTLAVAVPAVAIAVWARYAAPRSPRRLSARSRVPLELVVFGLAAAALAGAGHPAAAAVFATAIVVNALGLTAFGQWEA